MSMPELTNNGLVPTREIISYDEFNEPRQGNVAEERSLTIYIDKKEIVTLMTIGTQPELLVLGWLKNQRLVRDISHVKSIQIDWETDSAAITTTQPIQGLEKKISKRTVTTGCGQGTVFGNLMEEIDEIHIQRSAIKQSTIYGLLKQLSGYNDIYKKAGAVHACALCNASEILRFVEDIGRHNAVDAISGYMWLNNISGHDKLFYTTGRLTSEMVIKVCQMGIPVLFSRSGITQMGLEIAKKTGVTMISRAKGKHFLVFNGHENIEYDAIPKRLSVNVS